MATKASIEKAIEAIAAAEKITKPKLAKLSRDLLTYVPNTNDIDMVNRLVGVLSPANRRIAILFFSALLPWESEKTPEGDFVRFGKMLKGEKRVAKRMTAISEFLAEPKNNIWTWQQTNVNIDKKKDFAGTVTRAVTAAMKGDDKTDTPALDEATIIAAVFAAGMSMEGVLKGVALQEKVIAEAEALMQQPEIEPAH